MGCFQYETKQLVPVVADEKISFGKSLDLFDSVLLETKLHGWDAKNFYIQQQFKKG